jgi:hypothetical protein
LAPVSVVDLRNVVDWLFNEVVADLVVNHLNHPFVSVVIVVGIHCVSVVVPLFLELVL